MTARTEQPGIKLTGIIAWFAANPVAANLLVLLIVFCGGISVFTIRKSIMPQFESNMVRVGVPFLGATPEEVEEGVILRVEEAVQDLNGVKKITSVAREGYGQIMLEVESGHDINEVLDQVKSRVDSISTFPQETERPIVEKQEFQFEVMWISVYGDVGPVALKEFTGEVRDELLALPSVTAVNVVGNRDYEIAIEVSENTLREYGLTMSEIAAAIRAGSMDMPGGTIKTDVGDILLRTKGQVYTGREFADIALRSYPDGTKLRLGDIATIRDEFVETEGFSRFNGQPALNLRVQSTGDQSVLEIDAAVQKYIEEKKAKLPDGVHVDHWGNSAYYLKDRMNMMLTNMAQGAVLVIVLLTLFLDLKVSLWVVAGIPISFLGALWLMPITPFPTDVNVISLFGFLLVLGIVVDDGTVIGESIYTEVSEKGLSLENVIAGAQKVSTPVIFGVLTTIAAFIPMLMVGGQVGVFFESISMVVILCLIFSLIESKLALPAHLRKINVLREGEGNPGKLVRVQNYVNSRLQRFIKHVYVPLLRRSMENRYTTVAIMAAVMILSVALLAGNFIKFEFFPNVPSDFVQTNLTMNDGSPPEARNAALDRMEKAIHEVESNYLRDHPEEDPFLQYVLLYASGDTGGGVVLELTKPEFRTIDAFEVEERWRDAVGAIPGSRELRYTSSESAGGGARLNFQFSGADYEQMEKAGEELMAKLREYDGVFDIRSSYIKGSEEIRLRIKPEAENLNLSMSDLGRQVRQSFYGEEAQRIQRGRDDVRVMVRYPRSERRSIADLQNMRIRAADGSEVPFSHVAEVEFGASFTTINRVDRKRTVSITANADPDRVQSGDLIEALNNEFIPELMRKYPGVSYGLEGASQEEDELIRRIAILFGVALFMIYGLLAIPLKSYSQPLIIMSVIPFGFIGALIGHIIFGKTISMMSIFGLVALAGVIVNDSLLLVDFVNTARREGLSIYEAANRAGVQRFRAILLTTLTTFFGLFPIMFETSLQAQFVIPMALSLAFGVAMGTVITLLMVPALYAILDDILVLISRHKPQLALESSSE